MRRRRSCSCPVRGFPSRDVARKVHHRTSKHIPRHARRPVYFKRCPEGLWHYYPKTEGYTP